MYSKKITVVLCTLSFISLTASENNKKLHKQLVEKHEIEKEFLICPEREFLMYPENVDLEIDEKKLPKGVESLLGNTFLVPKGMDAKLIHPTFVPKRIPDFEISMTQ